MKPKIPITLLVILIAAGSLTAYAFFVADDQRVSMNEQLAYRHPEDRHAIDAVPAELASDVVGGAIYVPASSHVYLGAGQPVLLAITLNVHNLHPEQEISLRKVDYFSSGGSRIRAYLQRPRRLAPFETAEFLVEQFDLSGGAGANFSIEWSAPEGGRAPLVEAIMAGSTGQTGISFRTEGVPIATYDAASWPWARPRPR